MPRPLGALRISDRFGAFMHGIVNTYGNATVPCNPYGSNELECRPAGDRNTIDRPVEMEPIYRSMTAIRAQVAAVCVHSFGPEKH